MLEKLLRNLEYGNRFCGIEHALKNGNPVINSIVLKRSKNELVTESSFESETVESVCESLPKNQHATLVINNDKVLSKQLESEQQDALKLVYKAFPNINLDDFYFDVFSQKNNHFIALCRKDYVASLVDSYTKNKIHIIDISLGNNCISSIQQFLNYNQVFSSNARLELEENHITKIQKIQITKEDYAINGLAISSTELLPFSGALRSVLNNNSSKINFESKKEYLYNEFRHSRFFNQFLKFAGIFILASLLINFFVFSHYFNEVNNLKQLSQINQSTKQRIISLNVSVSKKQKMVEDLLKSNGSKSSFYSNTIIHSLPKSIVLSEFNYQPLLKRIKADKDIALEEQIITILGSSSDSPLFSSWISVLEQLNWITKVDIIDYGASSNSVADFKIKLLLSND